MKKFWLYLHTCPNGKRYVGITTYPKPEYRWQEGRGYYQNKHFYKAIRKYGWNNIKHEAWELTCESEMYYAEKYLIAYYHTTESKFGYNNSEGGECGFLGCNHSEKTRKKMSESHKKTWSDPEFRKKQSKARKGQIRSEEARKHLAEAAKKRWSDPEYRKKVLEANKGQIRSEEARKRMTEAIKKSHSDPEYRKKMSEIKKNKPKVKIKLPDGTIIEITKQALTRWYVNREKEFEYVS